MLRVCCATWLAAWALSCCPLTAKACGGDEYSYHFFNLFVPEWVLTPEYSPTFYTTHPYFHIWSDQDYNNDNLAEWQAFLKQEANPEALLYILKGGYSEAFYELTRAQAIRQHLFKNSTLPAAQIEAAKQYLLLALDLEKLTDIRNDWWDYQPETLSPEQAAALIVRIETALNQEKYAFLKERYAFQLVKSLRHNQQFEQAIAAYGKYFGKGNPQSIIRYWALDHVAGIQLSNGQPGQAYYNFLTVFKECRSRRNSAYYSFNITTEEDWQATYALCQSQEDRALMHFLRGSKNSTLGLHDLEQVSALLGNHEWLRGLMAREINKLESDNLEFYAEMPIETLMANLAAHGSVLKNQEQAQYAARLQRFAAAVAKQNPTDPFWAAAKAYLEFLGGDFDAARRTLDGSKGMEGAFDKIAREIKLAMLIIQKETFSPQEQDFIAAEIMAIFDDETASFYSERNNQEFILDLLAYRARKAGQHILANCFARQTVWYLKGDPGHAEVEELLRLIRQPQHTALELLALKYFMENRQTWAEFKAALPAAQREFEHIALDIKATLLMRDPSRLEEALAILESLPGKFDYPLDYNPFNMRILDCIHPEDCGRKAGSNFTRYSFLRKLIEIRDIANKTNSSTDYYLLGNAYYNMTWFGPAYHLLNYTRSSAFYAGFYDCSVALDYYEKALQYASKREEAAKICFMAAKAEQNLFFKSKSEEEPGPEEYWWGRYEVPGMYGGHDKEYKAFQREIKTAGYRRYFEQLKKEYRDTDYFKRAIKECRYLEYYVNRM